MRKLLDILDTLSGKIFVLVTLIILALFVSSMFEWRLQEQLKRDAFYSGVYWGCIKTHHLFLERGVANATGASDCVQIKIESVEVESYDFIVR